MEVKANKQQLLHFIECIVRDYETYAPQKIGQKVLYKKLTSANDIYLGYKRPIIPFKKILFPNGRESSSNFLNKKIALIGLNNCDVWAYHIFSKELKNFEYLPERQDIILGAMECKPNENCFCDILGYDKFADFDFYLQKEDDSFFIFSKSKLMDKKLKLIGIKKTREKLKLKAININSVKKFTIDNLSETVGQKEKNIKFWQGIAENCFGCGACTAVCPLCYCTRQNFTNGVGGKECNKLCWDTCFSKRFSEIQNHYDFRPENTDRLYNWYHHKFVRAKYENNHFLCTGCGRCIEACPANLNIKNILFALTEKNKNEK